MNHIYIGCIADDFTGAGDAASFLKSGGLNTILINGVPSESLPYQNAQAVVIALKTRNLPAARAVEESLAALDWFLLNGADQIYLKYCSTFDSTPEGNIGPVIDAFLEKLNIQSTLLCPALPINGRTVRNGCIYVNGIPLHKCPMKNHPLTPMWDCRIPILMEKQGAYPCMVLGRGDMEKHPGEIRRQVSEFASRKNHFYIVPEFESQNDAKKIVRVFGDYKLLTGGSGLLEELARQIVRKNPSKFHSHPKKQKILILAGSCSAATLAQIKKYQANGGASFQILPADLAEVRGGEAALSEKSADFLAERLMKEHDSGPLLLYTSDTPENVKEAQERFGNRTLSEYLESFLSKAAVLAYQNGCRNFIIAGGETSGAVTKALGFKSYLTGISVAPGVPILIPVKSQDTYLILKSGNFGTEDFFERAVLKLETLQEENHE